MGIPSKKNIIVRITAIIALVEFGIMLCFSILAFDIGIYTQAFLDVTLLVILSTPMIYIWIIKPYVVARDEALQQISHMAYHDPLTQLANRHLLKEYLEKFISVNIREKSYMTILFIDLDDFKAINDKNGHDAGDAVLVEVAKRLNSIMRNEDIVSRIGGDEFVVILTQLSTDEQGAENKALEVAERILKELNKDIKFKNLLLHIGASIGLRLLEPERISAESALNDADAAMFHAKREGKDRIFVHRK
jgi:two-component system cell cycle response regulator